MGVVEAIVAAVLQVVYAVWQVFELVRNAVSRMPDSAASLQRR